jgi:hypothetical protein
VCLSVCLSVRVCQCDSHWTKFCEVWYWGEWGSFMKICRETLDLVKIGKRIWYFKGRPRHFDNVDSCAKYFVARKQGKGTHCGISKATLNTFILLTVTCTSTTIRRERIVGFTWLLWLDKHAIIVSDTYIAYLVYSFSLLMYIFSFFSSFPYFFLVCFLSSFMSFLFVFSYFTCYVFLFFLHKCLKLWMSEIDVC